MGVTSEIFQALGNVHKSLDGIRICKSESEINSQSQ